MSKNKQKKKNIIKHTIDVDNEHDDQLSYESIDDEQYLNLLQGNLPKSHKSDVHLGSKYQGKRKSSQQNQDIDDDESINSDEIPDFQENESNQNNDELEEDVSENEIETNNQIKNKQKEKKTKPLSKFQKELLQIEQEDLEMVEKQKQNQQELKEVAADIKEQQLIWGNLVEIREQMQKSLDVVKKLPIQNSSYITEIQKSKDSKFNSLNCQLINNISNLLQLYSSLYKLESIDFVKDGYDQNLITKVNESLDETKKLVEDDVIRWSSKSALLQNITNKDNKQQMGFLLLTPIGQCKKALQNMDKLKQKTQLKRSIFRILGEEGQDLSEAVNKNIYDDTDFYLDLLKESIQTTNQTQNEETLKKETEQFILKRQAQRQEKQAKIVDRKASKNRKVRFEPHQKIINFMARKEEPMETISREEIIRNLFGLSNITEPQITKKRKQSIHDVNLI